MVNMAVLGDKDSVMGFKALGLHVEYADDADKASRSVHRLAKDGYAVIFITENLAEKMTETMERYKAALTPVIIPIPNNRGTTGFGMRNLSKNVEKAVGINILFQDEE